MGLWSKDNGKTNLETTGMEYRVKICIELKYGDRSFIRISVNKHEKKGICD